MTNFYDLNEQIREAMAREAIAEKKTILMRWETLNAEKTDHWLARTVTAASFLVGCASVVDIGCGNMPLERHLKTSTAYIPVDVVRRDERTIVVDLELRTAP